MGFIENAKKRCASATSQDQWRRALDNASKRAKALRAAGRAVDEPALESLKVQHKVWLSQKKKSSKAGETDKEDEQVEYEKVEQKQQDLEQLVLEKYNL